MIKTGSILVVDDEPMLREALELLEQKTVSFVILDLILPDLSGEEVCREIRKRSRVPVIILTAKTGERDMLNGLNIGADDYITKPFSMKNLYARIQAVSRRSANDLKALTQKFSWNDGDLIVDYDSREVFKNGRKITLTPSEWMILATFTKYPQRVFSRDDLLDIGFDTAFDGYDRIIDTHVKNLRRKIEDDTRNLAYIRTVYGIGFRFAGEKQ